MKKVIVCTLFSILFFSCAKESNPDLVTNYTGIWHSQEIYYYPHHVIEIRKDGNGSFTTERSSTITDVLSGKVTIIDNSILQINIEKMKINNVPELDSTDKRFWMEVEGVWYRRN